MVNVDFNMRTLDYYLHSDDELNQQSAEMCRNDFAQYGSIVLYFDNKMNHWRKTESAESYRQKVAQLDQKRHMIHNNCLNDIKMLNRMAQMDGQKPFATWETDGKVNRTDIGNAIVEQCYEQIIQGQTSKEQKENKLIKARNKIDQYNYMLGYTKYPLVKDPKNKHYAFVDLFSLKHVPYATVKNYVQGRTNDPEKLKILNTANDLVNDQHTRQSSHDEPDL